MKNRNQKYYILQREKHIKHRKNIVKHIYLENPEENVAFKTSKLNKGKVHCSCPMCSCKTKNNGWNHSDKVKLAKGKEPCMDSF